MDENIALIRFERGWEADGSDPETGLPRYREVVEIIKSIPPLTEVRYAATDADFHHPDPSYRDAIQRFQREQKGLTTSENDGFPLVMWPVIGPADLRACFDHEIYTVEQLAKLATRRDMPLPAGVVELAKKAQRMVELGAKRGKYETLISELEGQIAAVREDNNSMRSTIESQTAQIAYLQDRLLKVA
jgi:hypothetical protein